MPDARKHDVICRCADCMHIKNSWAAFIATNPKPQHTFEAFLSRNPRKYDA